MIQQASLSQLNDIAPPAAASWWPPTWWSIGIITVVVTLVVLINFWLIRRRLNARPRREAYKELQQLTSPTVEQITVLLKRVALAYYPKHHISDLHGKSWLVFLLSAMSDNSQKHFSSQLEQHDINKELYGKASKDFCILYQKVGCQWLQLDLSKMPGDIDV